jgi:PKD repeat protein
MPRNPVSTRFVWSAQSRIILAIIFFVVCTLALVWPAGAAKPAGSDHSSMALLDEDEHDVTKAALANPERDRDGAAAEAESERSESRDYLGRRKYGSEGEREMLLAASPDDGATEVRFRATRQLERLKTAALQNRTTEAAGAATSSDAVLSPGNPSITYGGGPFVIATNASDNAAGPVTCDQSNPCEDFGLTIDFPQSYLDGHPNDQLKIEISWNDPSGGQDLDTWLVDNPDDGTYPAHGGNGSANPEVITLPLSNIGAGPHTYFVRVAPFVSTGQAYTGKITMLSPAAATTPPTQPFVGIAPRYYNYAPGPGVGETAGEPSIGYNPITHKAMFISGLQTLRVTFPEDVAPAGSIAGACDATWEDVSYLVTKTKSLDPILFTDQRTGRTFVSQLDSVVPPASPVLIGLNSLMAYTDDDGATWTPAQINPPDGSYDHQSVGAGPYPASLPLGNPINKGDAVYYCSQAGVTAFCSRSDDGGLNFGRSTPIYNSVLDGCGGIHGHVKVAPDGTVYVPNRGCNNVQSVTVSEDAGVTWTVRHVQGQGFSAKAPPGILDPSVAIASDGTLYFSWISKEADGGHAHAAVSHDKGVTWADDRDLGALGGLHNAVFIEAVAGDPNRAAVGFVGTTEAGDHEADAFKGTWYAFIATTYDGGKTWAVVNATPNAPVQREAGIWNEGGSSALRNLLDFNEITMDEKGRVLYGFADGCVGGCESGGPNSFSSKATIARQSGGRGLRASFDPAEPGVPQRACLSGRRDDLASYLSWNPPDNGGSEITSYKIFRSTSTSPTEVLIGHAGGGKTSYNDRSTDPSVATYIYRVVAANAKGDGAASNSVALSVAPRLEPTGACVLPGVQILVDPTGDASDGQAAHDITSVSMSEPQALDGKIVFTIKVSSLALVPTGWRWAVRFGAPQHPPDHPVIGPQEDWFVSMVTSDGAAPAFTYGSTGVYQGASRVFVTLGNLDPASNATADGTITLILPKSAIGNPTPGQAITSIFGSVRATVPSAIPGTGGTNETIPDSTGTGSYALRPSNLCLPNTAPLARLTAGTESGTVPVTVSFDGSGSIDPDAIDTIASYTFNFGDGGDDVTQSSPVISHAFTKAGLYPVKLVVKDSRGKASSNTDQRLISVQQPQASPTPTPTPTATPTPTPTTGVTVQFDSATYSAVEGCVQTLITVKRSGPTDLPSVVSYTVNNDSATERGDFTFASGTLVFAAGETEKKIPFLISDDAYAEGMETATISLSAVSNTAIGPQGAATVQITDNDSSDGVLNPIDDAATFVGQHYHDFLNRQSDPDGQAFWTNELTACGTNANCIQEKRNNVSAAFFLSIEFQQTGYFAFRFYRASFPDTNQRPRALPRLLEFLRDTQQLDRNVVVGQPNWDASLEQNKQGFALDWVDRSDFLAEYPLTMTRDEFIDKLFARSGGAPTQPERNQALFAYDGGSSAKEKRARGIRAVVDSGTVYNAQYNSALVLMQYLGYLRRNPDNAPDNSYSGYDFWLNKLNSFSQPGEDVRDEAVARRRVQRADMIKAFLVSQEYRERFQGGTSRGTQQGPISRLNQTPTGWKESVAKSLWLPLNWPWMGAVIPG